VAPGGTLDVTVTTANAVGAAAADPSATRLYYSHDGTALTKPLHMHFVPSLPGGSQDTAMIGVTVPLNAKAGTRYLIAIADVNDDVAESVENKNVKKVSFTVN
jgi:hypothetical protein